MDEENELDFTKLKYVLYARKSTDDPQRQVRSIPDQIAECRSLAQRLGLHIIEPPLTETKSAKKPHQRPVFTQMLKEIRKGSYDAILAWNPDRLARNMLEAGMIIDMVDDDIIKDFKFVSHPFTKDANGKMLLGMSFVLSKQYSDDLSQKVTRGVRRSFFEGKSATPKHGYVRDENGYYRPDGKNFDLINEAWIKRKNGESLITICKFLNENGYGRIIKRTGIRVKMTIQRLSEIFKDPFYYGVLIQAGKSVDLRDIYDFKPAVREDDYNFIQQIAYRKIKPSKPHRLVFYPLRKMVLCSYCGQSMVVGPSTSHTGKKYLNFRCDTDGCMRPKKSIRSKFIFNFIYKFLEEGLNFTEKEYKTYYDGVTKLTEEKRQRIQIEIHSKEGSLKSISAELKDRSLKVLDYDKKSTVRKENEGRINELDSQRESLLQEIENLKSQLTDPNQDKLSIEQFLNLSKKAAVIVQSANVIVKDQICRLIFLNFTVNDEKVLSYQLKEPFNTLLKNRNFISGRGERN